MREIFKGIKKYIPRLTVTYILYVLSTLCTVALPTLMTGVVDNGINAGDIQYVHKACAMMAVITVLDVMLIVLSFKLGKELLADGNIHFENVGFSYTRTEICIQKAMDKLQREKTCFVIAHRLSTIVHADKILAIDKGRIVDIGKHEELLKRGGFYAELWQSQYAHA